MDSQTGDTMNTTSRMESSGETGRIHISKETAEHIQKSGKGNWLIKRDEPVTAKGKGDIQTYWIVGSGTQRRSIGGSLAGGAIDMSERSYDDGANATDIPARLALNNDGQRQPVQPSNDREERLVDWNVQMLLEFLKQIVARRNARNAKKDKASSRTARRGSSRELKGTNTEEKGMAMPTMDDAFNPLDEVREIIRLPEFDAKAAKNASAEVEIDPVVVTQLSQYVSCVAKMYQKNSFHNFEVSSLTIEDFWAFVTCWFLTLIHPPCIKPRFSLFQFPYSHSMQVMLQCP